MNIKLMLKTNPITKDVYGKLKKINDDRKRNNQFKYTGHYDNRSSGADAVCIVLAGYKEYLYNNVFTRLEKYVSPGIDVCIVSSGKYSDTLSEICKKNNWSYLSTKENNVSLVQNIAIKLHPSAKYIFKIDEDIFLTEGYFEKMLKAYKHSENLYYKTGFMAPVIPINGFTHYLVLEKLDLVDDYTNRFEKPIIMAGNHRMIQGSADVAKYFWGDGNHVPTIDALNDMFASEPIEEVLCPIRFSIGAILFKREFWEDMGYFHVDRSGNAMGMDETQICEYCMRVSRPIVISKNVVVGHFSFGPQTNGMIDYYNSHPEKFEIKNG